jgi:PAS domain S-box-containing protein
MKHPFDDARLEGSIRAEFCALFDGMGAVVHETDLNGWAKFVNQFAVDLFGYPENRWTSQPNFLHAIAYPADRPRVRAHHKRCARSGEPQQLEYRTVTAGGRVLWMRETLAPVRDYDGRTRSLRGVLWSIDEVRKAQEALAVATAELGGQLADMTYLHELGQRLWAAPEPEPLLAEILRAITSIQRAEMELVRLYEPETGELRVVASIGLPEAFLERYGRVAVGDVACGLAIELGQPVMIEDIEADPIAAPYREPARAGGYRAKYSTLMTARSGQLLGTIATCFREPHRPAKREIRLVELFARQAADFIENARLKQALREADRRKEEAVTALAHEVRNPVQAILNASQALRAQAADDSASADLCDLVIRQARMMGRLAGDLLETSRVGTGRTPLLVESVDVNSAMVKATQSVMTLVQDRRLELTIVPPPAHLSVQADPFRLEQILVNLLTNASHHTEPGGRITLDAWPDRETVAIRVRDTGEGIAPELLPRVFEPFVRAAGGSSPASDGIGIGLTLVKTFAERHGGSVTGQSDGPGRGSEFVVRLPRAAAGDAATVESSAERPATSISKSAPNPGGHSCAQTSGAFSDEQSGAVE